MPRPTKRTEETRAKLLAALVEGATRREAIVAAGIDQNTFYRWMRADKGLQKEVEKAERRATWLGPHPAPAYSPEEWRERWEVRQSLYSPPPQRHLSDLSPEEFDTMVRRYPFFRAWLDVDAGTHEWVYEGRGRGRSDLRRLWRVRKQKRAFCGAKTRKGTPCRARCLPGKARCKFHGGLSTGPRTQEGRAAIAESNRRRAEAKRAAQPGGTLNC